jgi:hypothetical protein
VPTNFGSRIAAISSSVGTHQAQLAEHLHVLFIMGLGLADHLLAQLELDDAAGICRLVFASLGVIWRRFLAAVLWFHWQRGHAFG